MNINKIIYGFALALAFVFSGSAMAAEVFGNDSNQLTVTAGTTGDCPLLAENVTLGVSANVVGGYACDEGNNIIQVGACHKGGSRDEVSCDSWSEDDPATPNVDESNPIPGCSSTDGVGNPDFKAFFATSAGGVMQAKALGNRCTEDSLGGLDDWAN